ncbi:hypothetical protein [Streptomyces sp. NPDC048111]|uniref:hypothetical protein n=1 Tax=Streptomyces sp. NPDC048111 TaxID=3365500 RepID=UPI003724297A
MRATRRTLRAAAIATGAVAALALPAGAAFADSPAAPSDGQTRPSDRPDADAARHKEQVPPGTDDAKKDDAKKDDAKKDGQNAKGDGDKDVRSFVTSVKLADGSVAKVYRLGQNHYEAEIWADGAKLDTLVAKGASATGQNNGLHVVLNPDGTVTSWIDGGKKDDKKDGEKKKEEERKGDDTKDERTKSGVVSSVRITMPDGRAAQLLKTSHGPRVEIAQTNGNALSTLDLSHPSVFHDGWTYKIVDAGKGFYKFVVIDGRNGGNSWVYDFGGRLIEKYTVQKDQKDQKQQTDQKDGKKQQSQRTQQAQRELPTADRAVTGVVPKGGVKAGAEGVEGASSDQAPLLAAGGGLAAAGAAGLGFAMLRRRGEQG